MKIIAHIYTDFPEKFGIPRQSGLVETKSYIVFEPPYNNPDAVRGLEEFSHIWLIWQFSKSIRENWSPTVRPSRLGGNTRVGVFASRSPFRPNPLGLSCVELEKIEFNEKMGTVLHVKGADILNGTPIYDIKPYLSYADSKPQAIGGFAHRVEDHGAEVLFERGACDNIAPEDIKIIAKLLAQDPRPHYQSTENEEKLKDGQENDQRKLQKKERVYGMAYKEYEVKFTGHDKKIIVKKIYKNNRAASKINVK